MENSSEFSTFSFHLLIMTLKIRWIHMCIYTLKYQWLTVTLSTQKFQSKVWLLIRLWNTCVYFPQNEINWKKHRVILFSWMCHTDCEDGQAIRWKPFGGLFICRQSVLKCPQGNCPLHKKSNDNWLFPSRLCSTLSSTSSSSLSHHRDRHHAHHHPHHRHHLTTKVVSRVGGKI